MIFLQELLFASTVAASHTSHVTVHMLLVLNSVHLLSHSYSVQMFEAALHQVPLLRNFCFFYQRRRNVCQIPAQPFFSIEFNIIEFDLITFLWGRICIWGTKGKGWGSGNSCTAWGRSQVRQCQQKKTAVTLLEELDKYYISTLHKCRLPWEKKTRSRENACHQLITVWLLSDSGAASAPSGHSKTEWNGSTVALTHEHLKTGLKMHLVEIDVGAMRVMLLSKTAFSVKTSSEQTYMSAMCNKLHSLQRVVLLQCYPACCVLQVLS